MCGWWVCGCVGVWVEWVWVGDGGWGEGREGEEGEVGGWWVEGGHCSNNAVHLDVPRATCACATRQ